MLPGRLVAHGLHGVVGVLRAVGRPVMAGKPLRLIEPLPGSIVCELLVPLPGGRTIPVELPKDGPVIGRLQCVYCGREGRLGTSCEGCGASCWTGARS